MLSKEEIEKAKDFMIFYKNYCLNKETTNIESYETANDEEFVHKNIETILKYIDQLESDKQKLIEKLEKILKEYENVIANEESAMNLYAEILEIVKGVENERDKI